MSNWVLFNQSQYRLILHCQLISFLFSLAHFYTLFLSNDKNAAYIFERSPNCWRASPYLSSRCGCHVSQHYFNKQASGLLLAFLYLFPPLRFSLTYWKKESECGGLLWSYNLQKPKTKGVKKKWNLTIDQVQDKWMFAKGPNKLYEINNLTYLTTLISFYSHTV